MKRFLYLVLISLLISVNLSHAAPLPTGGIDLLPTNWLEKSVVMGASDFIKHEKKRDTWQIAVIKKPQHEYQLQLSIPITGEIKKGDVLFLSFQAKGSQGFNSYGIIELPEVLEIAQPPNYTKIHSSTIQVTKNWTEMMIPCIAEVDSVPDHTSVKIMLGKSAPMAAEFSDFKLLNFKNTVRQDQLPHTRFFYEGREENAAWRQAALARIEKIRTTDFTVQVVDASNKPIPGVDVSSELKRHEFGFGAAVQAEWIAKESDATAEKYRSIVDENFSSVVFENDMKPFAMNPRSDHQKTIKALHWLKEKNYYIRGHYLCLGAWEEWSEKLKNQPNAKELIRKEIFDHINYVFHETGDFINEWDAVNHPVAWLNPRNTVDLVAGSSLYADVFKRAKELTDKPLIINEDQVFRPGRQQEEFYQCIQGLLKDGAKIGGIGNQAHFDKSSLPPPVEMLRISDRFAALVPNLVITEFDVETDGDEELQADWLRDCLIMAYSHPAYSQFILWSIWEKNAWKPATALWRSDWTAKPNAKIWQKYVNGLWKTKKIGKTDSQGMLHIHGHKGLYEILVKGRSYKFSTEGTSNILRIVLAN